MIRGQLTTGCLTRQRFAIQHCIIRLVSTLPQLTIGSRVGLALNLGLLTTQIWRSLGLCSSYRVLKKTMAYACLVGCQCSKMTADSPCDLHCTYRMQDLWTLYILCHTATSRCRGLVCLLLLCLGVPQDNVCLCLVHSTCHEGCWKGR